MRIVLGRRNNEYKFYYAHQDNINSKDVTRSRNFARVGNHISELIFQQQHDKQTNTLRTKYIETMRNISINYLLLFR